MSGFRMIFISEDYKVFKISQPKNCVYKPVKKLSGENVLEVGLYYETLDRKPTRLLNVFFNRLKLDENGLYILTDDELARRTRNVGLLTFETPETYCNSDRAIEIPSALTVPTPKEKEVIIGYMKEKLPQLYPDGCYVVEKFIYDTRRINEKNRRFMKGVAKLRALNERESK